MNRFTIPILILLGSLLFSWFFNTFRRPICQGTSFSTQNCCDNGLAMVPIVDTVKATIDTTQKVLTAEEQVLFTPLDAYFDSGKSSIKHTPEVDSFLATAKKYFAKYPNEKMSLVGHTDSDGSDASNLVLSKKRAEVVKSFLVKDGFAAVNLVTSGEGESQPLVDNSSPENKAKNRRVSIRLIK